MVQWRVISLPVQGTWVQSLVQEDSTCCEASKPVRHNYWAFVPQQEKPPWWEALALQWRPSVAKKKKANGCLFYSYMGSISFTPAELKKNIYNLKVKSYILLDRNFEDFKPGRQHINFKQFSTFLCMGRCKNLGSLKSFPQYAPQLSGSLYPISQVSSGLTIGCSCSVMAARCQVFFSFWSFLRTHQLTLEGYKHWLHF